MSCTSNPVNIRNTNQTCKEECSYEFDYNPTSSAIVTNMGNYLDIKVDGTNNVKFNSYKVELNDVRLYQPSLHLFKGQQVAAELIISHSGYDHTILVCIPIMIGDGKSPSNNFFSQLIPHISPKTDDKTDNKDNINVSNWSLNNVVPHAGTFYFYNGEYPYPPCNGKVNFVVFDTDNAARMNSKDWEILKSLITPTEYSQKQSLNSVASKTPLLMINKAGDGSGGGVRGPGSTLQDYFIFDQCESIDGMEEPSLKDKKVPQISGWVTIIILLIGALIIFALIYSFLGGSSTGEGGSGNMSGGGAHSCPSSACGTV